MQKEKLNESHYDLLNKMVSDTKVILAQLQFIIEKPRSLTVVLEGDGLQLTSYLSTLFGTSETELFVRESPIHKLKGLGTIVAAAIPIIISIIQLQNELSNPQSTPLLPVDSLLPLSLWP